MKNTLQAQYLQRAKELEKDRNELRAALTDATEVCRQLEVIDHGQDEIWLHLRPGKGLVSIRITEPPMIEAYRDWWKRLTDARAALAKMGGDDA